MITHDRIIETISTAAGIKVTQAEVLFRVVWEIVGRELSVGEAVDIPGLGRFEVVKVAAQEKEGGDRIVLPTNEPEFEPAAAMVRTVTEAILKHPELFPQKADDTTDDEEEDGGSDVAVALPDEDDEEQAHYHEPEAPVPPKPEVEAAPVPEHTNVESEKKSDEPAERPLGRASNIVYMDLAGVKVERSVLQLIPRPLAEQYGSVPVRIDDGKLIVGMIDPEDFEALQLLRRQTGYQITPVLCSRDDISVVLDQYTGLQAELQELVASADLGISDQELAAAENESAEDSFEDDAPTAKIVNQLLRRAVKEKASDIHIEPYEKKLIVRFRLDGILVPRVELPKAIQAAIIARLKIISLLKIDEQRLPQDGRFSITVDNREVDFRLSTIPVVFGEKVVMRILDKQSGIRQLKEVGLMDRGLEVLESNAKRSHGMILVTGPTGSGKTTTLYAVLGKLMGPDINVLTLEDPVEYRIESINQSQVHSEIGYTFAAGLRAVVRQDPDVVMLGEIRDHETAEMAIHAALTGHVVLSTLHTNSAAGAFPRLIDMGVEPFLITSSVHTVIGQRLVRVLDPDHRKERELNATELDEVMQVVSGLPEWAKDKLKEEGYDLKKPVFYEPVIDTVKGIKGYKGRMGVFEVLNVTEPIRELVGKRSSDAMITEYAIKHDGMLTMVQDGIIKAIRGITTIEEIWRVTRE
jgi:type IV pilus assembly protein PilB